MSPPPNPTPRIAILGAGPSGLTLALLLSQSSIRTQVFDADASPAARNQGGTLDLDPSDGQRALAAVGLTAEFQALSRTEGQARRQLDAQGKVLWDDNDSASLKRFEMYYEKPEIERGDLRALLLGALGEGAVQWGRKVTGVRKEERGEGQWVLEFKDGVVEGPFDLVVGADGAWSRVRPVLTDVGPVYSGISMVELWAENVDGRLPFLSTFTGRGSSFLFDEGRAVIAQRQGGGDVRMYVAVRQPEDWVESCGIEWSEKEAAKEKLLEGWFEDCAEEVKRAIRECDGEMVVRKLFMLPVGHTWEGRKGVTMIGDAAHLMTPFAGVGVNVAMRDAVELGERLVQALRGEEGGLEKMHEAVRDFEEEMFLRAEKYATESARGIEGHFSSSGNKERVQQLKRGLAKREAWLKSKGL
ncbi:MAG: hypothetical protein MMC23_000430 [Stictis urceolatum]|nr:hypothetical protein [Stictis urceolata]